jgi:FkbM family methyltransferase
MVLGFQESARRAMRGLRRFSGDPTLTRVITFRGCTFFASPLNKVERRLLSAQYDDAHFDFIEKVVHPGCICFDVGANVGVYSVILSRIVGPNGQVHAFEPVAHIRSRAVRNLMANAARNTTVNASALGAEPGEIEMFQVKEGEFRGGTSSIHATENMKAMGMGAFEKRPVPIETIDAYVKRKNIPYLDFIKIDIEGHELDCLRGARDTLTNMGPMILFEHSQARLKHLAIAETDFRDLFDAIGYDAFEIVRSESGLALKSYDFSGRALEGRDLLGIKRW